MPDYSKDLDAHDQGMSEAESRGGDHRPTQDNGTHGASNAVNYPRPPDVNAPHGDDGDDDSASALEHGVTESKEVGHQGSVADYGFTGKAGGGVQRNIKD